MHCRNPSGPIHKGLHWLTETFCLWVAAEVNDWIARRTVDVSVAIDEVSNSLAN
jgi:hypothetical protein